MLALTMGDPAGIGGELAVRAWAAGVAPFVALDDADRLASIARSLGLAVPVCEVADTSEAAKTFATALPVLPMALPAPVIAGRPDAANAPAIIAAIERAVALALAGKVAGIVTNPVSKAVLYEAGFCHPGHTEFLAALTGTVLPVMLLACPGLRVVPVSIHCSLRDAISRLDANAIIATCRVVDASLRAQFGIDRPRLAVAGLNPHAGEQGSMGREELEVIAPAIARLRDAGIDASGPFPPDTMFTEQARAGYDVAIGMYHDQVLIPLKTLDMHRGVNVTLGLPVVRTSPDHGTAFGIAGQGIADPSSLIAAIELAAQLAARRTA